MFWMNLGIVREPKLSGGKCIMHPFQEEIFELLLAGKLKARNDSFYEVLFATLSSYIYFFLLLWLIQTKTEWKWERSCWNSCAYAVLCPCAHLSSLKLELTISIIFELFPPGGDNLTGWEVKHPSSRCVRGLKNVTFSEFTLKNWRYLSWD